MATLIRGRDTAHLAARREAPSAFVRRAALAAALLAVAAGTLWTHATPAPAWTIADPELARLLSGMALIKAAIAVAALGVIAWRLGWPASPRLAAGYTVAGALMAAGPGLIWGMAHLVAGAMVFHAGLAMLIVLAWADGELPLRRLARDGSVRLKEG